MFHLCVSIVLLDSSSNRLLGHPSRAGFRSRKATNDHDQKQQQLTPSHSTSYQQLAKHDGHSSAFDTIHHANRSGSLRRRSCSHSSNRLSAYRAFQQLGTGHQQQPSLSSTHSTTSTAATYPKCLSPLALHPIASLPSSNPYVATYGASTGVASHASSYCHASRTNHIYFLQYRSPSPNYNG